MKKLFHIIIIYALFVFFICFAVGFSSEKLPVMVSESVIKYKFFKSMLLFLKFVPAILVSAFLVGVSISFKLPVTKNSLRFSSQIYKFYRVVVSTALIVTAFVSLASETGYAFFSQKQQLLENENHVFFEYMDVGRDYLKLGQPKIAMEYADRALKIFPNNKTAVSFLKESEQEQEKLAKSLDSNTETETVANGERTEQGHEYTVYELLQKAKEAGSRGQWLNAHYYAQLAVNLADPKDTNMQLAKETAAHAWNRLLESKSHRADTEQNLFQRKLAGYNALLNGDSLKAYYIFHEMSAESRSNAKDPDVQRYLAISRERLESQYFFLDETKYTDRFELLNNVYFKLIHDDGTIDVIFIGGVTPVKAGGKMIEYFHNFSMYSFSSAGKFTGSVSVLNAKMSALPVDYFDPATRRSLKIKDNFKYVPYILLTSVDKNSPERINKPKYDFADARSDNETAPALVLAMPYSDFSILADASFGPEKMNLGSLLKLAPKAARYGYSGEVFTEAMMKRVLYPFFILIILLFIASFSWNNRVGESQLFKFKWIFFFPVVTGVVYLLLLLLSYIASLLNYFFIGLAGRNFALFPVLVTYGILFIIASVLFLSRRNQ
ncbi:MAG: hypothetical protein LKF96_00715 [Treponema sp.]|jgi:hypothetical protein|nr:hypothetical protein [Treponema sp.]